MENARVVQRVDELVALALFQQERARAALADDLAHDPVQQLGGVVVRGGRGELVAVVPLPRGAPDVLHGDPLLTGLLRRLREDFTAWRGTPSAARTQSSKALCCVNTAATSVSALKRAECVSPSAAKTASTWRTGTPCSRPALLRRWRAAAPQGDGGTRERRDAARGHPYPLPSINRAHPSRA
jgi:hypothetical protein